MELDDLKLAWQTLDRRLDQQAALQQTLFAEGRFDKTQSSLRPLIWGQFAQILFGVLLALWAGSFWFDHSDVPHLLVAGLLVNAYAALAIGFAAATLAQVRQIDYAAPVLAIQKQLGQLRRIYVLNGLCAGLPWWILWVPVAQIGLMTTLGADLYVNAESWFWSTYAVGLLGWLGTWSLQRWARNPRRPRLAQAVEANLGGSSLRRAQRFLDQIAQFERA